MLTLACTLCIMASPAQLAPGFGRLAPARAAFALFADATPAPPPPASNGIRWALCGVLALYVLVGVAVVGLVLWGFWALFVFVITGGGKLLDGGPARPAPAPALAWRF